MTTCAEWATKLAAAEAALHQLNIGGQLVSIKDGVSELKYSAATTDNLVSYVKYLQAKVDACNGARSGGGTVHFTPVDC